ncbi:helix-turn-helix transcriptional regulator [Coleofasciculus sp. E2-BRE-01]|uniref:helix-turn-helix transcriptional regulator n=1 Tax=Coleofasciculus sp. E2-BRE-01 TaxID=3069524 RepID=UPI0040639A06
MLELRKRLDWTQPQLAEYLGINERTVRSHERDYHRLRLELWQYKKLHQLMASVGMTVDDLPDPPK